jgi:RNA polymerase sigma factor (sigma-70 family)
MADGTLREFLQRLRWTLRGSDEAAQTDAALLQRFLDNREELAFTALIQRHGPMVLGVCRYVAQNAADAEDAFQATFLVLVRRAASLQKPHLLGNWLYGVAYRVAARARAQAARRHAREQRGAEMIPAEPRREAESEWRPVLHQELSRLPEKYRAPMVLCYLQGKRNEEAAQLLGWPVGTVKGRLTRGRELLRQRLTRRGVVLSSGVLAGALTPPASSATLPMALLESTVRAAMLVAAGPLATAGVSVPVATLTNGVLQSMFLTRFATAWGMVVGVSLLGSTTALFAYRTLGAGPRPEHTVALAEPGPLSPEAAQADPEDEQGDEAARARRSTDNLKMLGLAMHNYVSDFGQFPPAGVYSKDGKPLLSWRVLLLPYLDHRELFNQFKLDEPWDSPANQKLLDKMPAIYSPEPGKGKQTTTLYQVFTGAGTVFPGSRASKVTDITDGTSNTILIVEAADAVPWTRPADLPYDPKKPLPKLGGVTRNDFRAALADGAVRTLKKGTKEATLRALITSNGGEVIDPDEH